MKAASETLALDIEINYQKVESHSDAERLKFRGSPSILISRNDPFADPNAPMGLSCRIYQTGGKISSSPGVEALREAIRGAAGL